MATVWLARDLKHDRLVALKILRPELAAPGEGRFAREIGIVAKLNHPNILAVLDSGLVGLRGLQAPYYVMPYVEGSSLSALLQREEKLPVDEALRLSAEVADALDYAHSRGVVHRDIKPGNILIQAGHALVADFGVAIALDAAGASQRHTTLAGEVLGTPVYMSPEQAAGESRLDGRSDVYSLGCVLYEMLAGAPPLEATTPQAMLVAHLSTEPAPLASRRPDVPPAVAGTVHKALAKMPEARWPSAAAFRDALIGHRGPVATRRRWWPTAVLVAGVGLLAWWGAQRMQGHKAISNETVVVLSGFRDPSGTLRAQAAQLNDAMRRELQGVPGLRLIDVSEETEQPTDTLRLRHGAEWVVRGVVDQVGDSVRASARLLDGGTGAVVSSSTVAIPSQGSLAAAATAYTSDSPFGIVRYGLDSILLTRWQTAYPTDSVNEGLRRRAAEAFGRNPGAMLTVGPRRMLEELALADSLLQVAQQRSPSSVVLAFDRAVLARKTGFVLGVARQFFPDSAWLPDPMEAFHRAVTLAGKSIAGAPGVADTWLARGSSYNFIFLFTQQPQWRDSALKDLRRASTMAGDRPDIWVRRANLETFAGLWGEALFSAEQGLAADHLHVYSNELLARRARAELAVGEYRRALDSCHLGERRFPGSPYFIACAAEVLSQSSADPADARMILVLADSLATNGLGELPSITTDELHMFAAAILSRAHQSAAAARAYDAAASHWSGEADGTLLLDAAYARQEMGDLDSALALSARAVRRDPMLVTLVERAPQFQPLRRHPAFPAAMQGISPPEAR